MDSFISSGILLCFHKCIHPRHQYIRLNAVYQRGLFQSLCLRRRASYAMHTACNQNACHLRIHTKKLANYHILCYLCHEFFLLNIFTRPIPGIISCCFYTGLCIPAQTCANSNNYNTFLYFPQGMKWTPISLSPLFLPLLQDCISLQMLQSLYTSSSFSSSPFCQCKNSSFSP